MPVNRSVKKLIQKTTFLILIATILFFILTPIFFLTSLSFLSSREAYQFPLPILPSLKSEFVAQKSEKGYLISIYEPSTGEYESVVDTNRLEKISTYFRRELSIYTTPEKLREILSQLDNGDIEKVHFTMRKSLWHNYRTFFKVTGNAKAALIRSIQTALVTILISLILGGMAGYAFARFSFKGKEQLRFGILFVRMFPAVTIALPMVILLAKYGFYDRPIGLSLVYSVGSIGLTAWITASIFMGIGIELEEAAQVFGANKLQTFFKITLPLAFPGLAASSMYAFIGAWNDTVSALILTQSKPTFAVVVYKALIGSTGKINLTAAGALTMAFPAVVFTLFIRKYINQMWGGVKV